MLNSYQQLKIALRLLGFFTLLTGLMYPLLVTGVAQLLFPWRANGSLISQQGKNVGSALIGQSFSRPDYFWGRPSATPFYPYNAEQSSASNLGPSNPNFLKAVKNRIAL